MRIFAQPRENGSITKTQIQGRYSLESVGPAHLLLGLHVLAHLTRFQTLAAFVRLDASERAITSMILNRITSRKDRLSYTPKQADPALHSDWNNCQRQVVRQRCQDECVTQVRIGISRNHCRSGLGR